MRESGRAEQITATIIETARQCNLDKDVALPGDDEAVKALSMDERDMIIGNVYRWGLAVRGWLFAGMHEGAQCHGVCWTAVVA
jgi:magnesium chelatase subunit H